MNRPQITPQPPHNHRQRELRLIAHLQRQGLTITRGWLVDARRGNAYPHPRVIERMQP